jgi:O-Antigen ligase
MRRLCKGIETGAAIMERCALYAVVFSLPLQALAFVPGLGLTITKVAGALLVLSVAGRHTLARRAPFRRSGLESGILAFALACACSVPGSMNRGDSLHALWTFVQYALVFYAVVRVSSRETVQERIPWLMVGAAAVAGLGALAAMSGHLVPPTVDTPVPHSNIRRLCFGLPDANEQALFFLFAMAFLLFSPGLWRGRWRSLLSGSAACVIAIGMVLTMSRTGWVCAAFLAAGRGVLARKRMLYGGALALLASAVLCVLAMAWPDSIDLARRRMREAVGIGDHSLASRVAHYTSVMEAARDGGAFGHGLDTTLELSQSFRDPRGERIGVIVHSVPLIMWLDLGWVGLLSYGWLWSCIAAHLCVGCRRAPPGLGRSRIMAYGALVGVYALVSLVMPFVYRSGFAILLGCAVGAVNAASPTRKPPPRQRGETD